MSLTKLARSFDAQRKKQYWQLLKRLYGGSDEAVAELRKTRDPGIYHGTSASNVPSILEQGLLSNLDELYGKKLGEGVYLGPGEVAKRYNQGGLFRLKLPSELTQTKTLYPDPKQAVSVDLNHGRGRVSIANNLYQQARLRQLSDPEFADVNVGDLITFPENIDPQISQRFFGKLQSLRNRLSIEDSHNLPFLLHAEDFLEKPIVPIKSSDPDFHSLRTYYKAKHTPELLKPIPLEKMKRDIGVSAYFILDELKKPKELVVQQNIPPSLLKDLSQ